MIASPLFEADAATLIVAPVLEMVALSSVADARTGLIAPIKAWLANLLFRTDAGTTYVTPVLWKKTVLFDRAGAVALFLAPNLVGSTGQSLQTFA